jgi:hypothetical protein
MTEGALGMTKGALGMTKGALGMTKTALGMTKAALGMTNWVMLECLSSQSRLNLWVVLAQQAAEGCGFLLSQE